MKNILLASDGSENALRAAGFAAELAALATGVKVTIIVVNDILEKTKYYSPLRTPVVLEQVEAFYDERVQDAMNSTMAVFDKKQIKADGVIKIGNPAQEIVDLAHEKDFDLIVIGSRGMGSLRGIVLGSASSKVIQLASCPHFS